MPPKKAKTKKAKKSGDGDASGTLGASDQLTKAQLEIEALQRELALKNDINLRLKTQVEELRVKVVGFEEVLQQKSADQVDLTSDMSRQYKSMQSELIQRVNELEATNTTLNNKILHLQFAFKESNREHDKITVEKDTLIEDQASKMTFMTNEFENMLNQTLNKMTKKLEVASSKWKENDTTQLSEASQKRVNDFHLTRLKLGRTEGGMTG